MRKILIALFAGALFCSPAYADWTGKDASSATITFKNPVACASVVCVPVVQLYDGTNVVTLTTAGADGASNTLTGVPTYARMQKYNGTTWDRWTGAVTVASGGIASGAIASGAFASGSIGSGAMASGAFASGSIGSGAVASGAVASGAYASGSIASGAMVDLGSQADAACSTATGACSLIALRKYNNQSLPVQTSTGTGWTSGTAGNTTQAIMSSAGWPAILVQLNQTSTISGGAVTFEGTYDGSNWVTVPVAQILNPNTFATLTNPYTLVQSTNQPFLILTQGYQQVRLKLSTVITGSATVTPQITLLPYNPTIGALLNPLVAGSAVIGKVGIDQTTPNTTNHVSQNPYPDGAVPYTASATGTTAATTATLAGASSVTTYLCGFSIRANATAAATGNATVTGTITATLNYTQWTAPLASGLGVTEETFTPCVPASGVNTSIAVISAAPGSGGTVSVTAWGYKL